MKLIETCSLTSVSIVICHYTVTLGESNEGFTINGSTLWDFPVLLSVAILQVMNIFT